MVKKKERERTQASCFIAYSSLRLCLMIPPIEIQVECFVESITQVMLCLPRGLTSEGSCLCFPVTGKHSDVIRFDYLGKVISARFLHILFLYQSYTDYFF